MALQLVDTSSGQVSGVDDLSKAASSVVNWETDEAGINRPRAGLATYTTAGAGTAASIGLCLWKQYIINVTADRYVRVLPESAPDTFTVVSTGTSTTQLGGTARAVFAIGDSYVYMAGGGQILRWSNDGNPPSTLTSSPQLVTHVSILGQRLIANDRTQPNFFFWSDIGEGAFTSWPAANASAADARPDEIVAHYENTNELFIFGQQTLQVYAVGSDPTIPFESVTTVNTGLAAPYAVCRLDESFAFLDDKRRIVVSDGRSVEPLSDAIQKTLRNLSTVTDCWMYREERGQMSLLVVRFPTERRTFVYDMLGKKWTERDYYVAPFPADFPVSAYAYWPRYNYHLFGSSLSSAGLLRFSEDARQDLSAPLVCQRVTGWHDFGSNNHKRSLRLRLVMRRGTAAQNATPGALEVRVQNDDSPWGTWQPISVGGPDQYEQVRDLYLGGVFRRRRYAFRYSNTDNTSLVSAHDDVAELAA